jgi:UDP-GlcNAc:undecaprenyl-phosphate GlcNAc-1-phosphate transferase
MPVNDTLPVMTSLMVQYLQVLGFATALVVALLVVPAVTLIAQQKGWLDQPNERKIHQHAIPRFGGVGIWAGVLIGFAMVAYTFGRYPSGQTGSTGILVGGSLMFLLGLLDDRYDLSAYIKLFGQLAIAVITFYLGVQINALDLPGSIWLVLHDWSMPVTVLWLVGMANAMNFIDGIDGLAGGVGTISALTLAVVAVFTFQPISAIFAALLAGSCLGFLVYNTHPARVFMGDSGSLFIGFTLAAIGVTGVLKTQVAVMLVPVLVLSVPILEIVYSTSRRLLQGKNPFVADADHLHHRLLASGLSPLRIVMMVYAICIFAGMLVTSYVHDLESYVVLLMAVGLLWLALLWLRFFHDTGAVSNTVEDPNLSSQSSSE